MSTSIAINGSSVFAAWVQGIDIMFSRSLDSGKTFSAPVNVSSTSGTATSPVLASPTGSPSIVYLFWADSRSGTNKVMFRKSSDGGVTFTTPKVVSTNASVVPGDINPRVALSGATIYVAWESHPFNPNGETLFCKSTDGGNIFSTPLNIDNYGYHSFDQSIAGAGSNVYVAWTEDTSSTYPKQVGFNRSINGGGSFATAGVRWLTQNTVPSGSPKLAALGSVVHLVYALKLTTWSIAFKSSLDSGATFGSAVLGENPNSAVDSTNPDIAVTTDGSIHVVWRENLSTGGQTFYGRKLAGTTTWSVSKSLGALDAGMVPKVIADGNVLYVIWENAAGDVLFTSSTDFGSTFTTPQVLFHPGGAPPPSDTVKPTVAITQPTSGSVVNTKTPVIRGTASDDVAVAKVEVSIDGGIYFSASGTTSWSYTAPLLAEGSHTVSARSFDTSNNVSTIMSVSFMIDTLPPAITITSPKNGDVITGPSTGVTFTVTGTASDAGSGVQLVEVSIDSGPFSPAAGTTSWSKSVTITTSGVHTITIRATDGSTNTALTGFKLNQTLNFMVSI